MHVLLSQAKLIHSLSSKIFENHMRSFFIFHDMIEIML